MDDQSLTQTVSERYARAAATGERMCCPSGYDLDELRAFIPEDVLKISYGCGTPVGLDTVRPGETVLDIGSGGGIDCFDAARRVGPAGRVIGLDMTDAMLEIARRHAPTVAANLGYATPNMEFRKGQAEAMPVEDASVDLIISNCVINLSPDKAAVFREMYRVLKPGGRFTISDIVADRPVPNYLLHDREKWGNCLSGALPVHDYVGGMVAAGFLGVHQAAVMPWRVVDGIHFLSITLTGYKLPEAMDGPTRFATLRGPFSRAVDELGLVYERGRPAAITPRTASLLATPGFDGLFLLSERPTPLDRADPRWLSIPPAPAPCVWLGHFALLTGPFVEAEDDDHHRFERGRPLEICSKTLAVLESESYRRHFAVINRAGGTVSGEAVSCGPSCC